MFKKLVSRTVLVLILLVMLMVSLPLNAALSDEGRPGEWTKYASNPVLNVGTSGSWDDTQVWDPAVLFDGTLYRMWYTGDRGSRPQQIGYATSSNGISWTRYGGNPVLSAGSASAWDETSVRGAAVISDTGVFKMWHTGRDASGNHRIGYATSPDGIVWTKHSNPVVNLGSAGSWDESRVSEPTVIKDGSTYKMWYRGYNSSGRGGIGYATSPDGVTWTKYGSGPILSDAPGGNWDYTAYAPSVVVDGSVYYMWYSGGNYAGTAWEIGYATSADGINWTKKGRVVQQGPDGSFDRYSADYSTALLISDTFKVWYSGADTSNYRIGYASAPSLVLTRTVYLPLSLKNWGACNSTWFDDFSDYHSGWPIEDDSEHTFAYTGGEYQIVVKGTNQFWWSSPGVQMTDGVITTKLRFANTGDNLDHGGIVFGASTSNGDDFYRVIVLRSGVYCISRHSSSSNTDLKCDTATSYLAYPATNRLKVIRNGAVITAYLNGQLLATVSDSTYTGSLRVGLVARSYTGGSDVRFDDYGVYPVSCSDQVP